MHASTHLSEWQRCWLRYSLEESAEEERHVFPCFKLEQRQKLYKVSQESCGWNICIHVYIYTYIHIYLYIYIYIHTHTITHIQYAHTHT